MKIKIKTAVSSYKNVRDYKYIFDFLNLELDEDDRIEINSLEQILEFMKVAEQDVILSNEFLFEDVDEKEKSVVLTIYDGYME